MYVEEVITTSINHFRLLQIKLNVSSQTTLSHIEGKENNNKNDVCQKLIMHHNKLFWTLPV